MRYRGRRRKYRKSRKSGAGGFAVLVTVLSKQHWMFNLVAAVASYFVLNSISMGGSGGMLAVPGSNPIAAVFSTISSILKYILPVIFIVAGISSFIRQLKRQQLLRGVRKSNDLSRALSALSWQDFEHLVGQMFRERGYSVVEGRGQKDGGIDLTLTRRGRTSLVQCKHWRTSSVGVAVVRELFGVMTLNKAHGAYVVCSGHFTKDASAFARKANVKLIGISELEKHLR